MPVKETKFIINAFVEEVWNKKNVKAFDGFFAADFVEHDLANPGHTADRESAKQGVIRSIFAFPDLHVTYDDVIAEGDKVAVRLTCRASHKGEFMGIAPTGKVISYTGIAIFRVAEGKIAEIWELIDSPGLMRQLGAI